MQPIDVFDSTQWTTDERRYFEIVDKACAESRNMVIGNGNAMHAVYLMNCFLRHTARETVRLFSGKLVQRVPWPGGRQLDVYANERLIESAAVFLERPHAKLRILLEDSIDVPEDREPEDHPLIAWARKAPGDLELAQISTSWRKTLKEHEYMVHWMTVDDMGFRLERNTQDHTALANFRHKKYTKALSDLFDKMSATATPLLA